MNSNAVDTMSIYDILSVAAPLIPIGIWLLVGRGAENNARRRIGGKVVEVRLYQRWSMIVQAGAILTALTLLLVALYMLVRDDGDAADFVLELVRASWLGTVVYGLRRQGRLIIGDNGLAVGQAEMIRWEAVRAVHWDRDIGQRLWGMTIEVRIGTRIDRRRFYFRRDIKPEVEKLIGEFMPASSPSQMPVQPSPRMALR